MSKKNKAIIIVAIVLMVIVFAVPFLNIMYNDLGPDFGLSVDPLKQEYTEKVYVEGTEIRFLLPRGYYQSEHDSFNAFYQNDDANFCVFANRSENLTDFPTRESYFDTQNESIMSDRDSVYVQQETVQYEVNDLKIHKKVYSAYKDSTQNQYYCYLVEFKENPDVVAWVMVIALPEYGDWYEDVFDYMVASAKLMKQTKMVLSNDRQIGDSGMQFTLSRNFQHESHDSFDAYFENGDSNIGVYAYDLKEERIEMTPLEVFEVMNEANVMDRDGAKLVGERTSYAENEVQVTKEVYSVDDEGTETYFLCYLVEFNENPEKLAYVMVVGYKDYISLNERHYDKMMASGTLVVEEN